MARTRLAGSSSASGGRQRDDAPARVGNGGRAAQLDLPSGVAVVAILFLVATEVEAGGEECGCSSVLKYRGGRYGWCGASVQVCR